MPQGWGGSCATHLWLKRTHRDRAPRRESCGRRVARLWCRIRSPTWAWPRRSNLTPWCGPTCRAATSWHALGVKGVSGSTVAGSAAAPVRRVSRRPTCFARFTQFPDIGGILSGSDTSPRPVGGPLEPPVRRYWPNFLRRSSGMRSRVSWLNSQAMDVWPRSTIGWNSSKAIFRALLSPGTSTTD